METEGQNVSDLHERAMDLAEKAYVMLHEACTLEVAAAELALRFGGQQPTTAVLFRSAASIAMELGMKSLAGEMIQKGLESDPPGEIEEELQLLKSQLQMRLYEPDQSGLTNSDECGTMEVKSDAGDRKDKLTMVDHLS